MSSRGELALAILSRFLQDEDIFHEIGPDCDLVEDDEGNFISSELNGGYLLEFDGWIELSAEEGELVASLMTEKTRRRAYRASSRPSFPGEGAEKSEAMRRREAEFDAA